VEPGLVLAQHPLATRRDATPAASNLSGPLTFRTYASVAAIPRETWERLLPGEPESWDFYSAVAAIPPPGFKLGAIAALDGDRTVAAAPLFRVAYRFDTSLQGRLRQVTDWIHARLPSAVSLPVIGVGSPMSDNCTMGFAPDLSAADCARTFDGLLRQVSREAAAEKCALIAVKGLDRTAEVLAQPLQQHGYSCVTSVPLVMLDLPYRSLDQYLDALPEKVGSYFRRKMRSASQVRIEYRSSIAGLEDRLNALFESTLKHSRVDYGDFEKLHPDYFSQVLRSMGDKAQLMLCWRGDELLSFQLFLVGRDRVLAKQIGMQYPAARELNLYFVNWLKLIEFAIERRIPMVEMGATTYATKLLFGGYLERRFLHFRFRGALANMALSPLAPLFDFERNDPELAQLDPRFKADMGPRLCRVTGGVEQSRQDRLSVD
jgi:hypothetical protein